MTGTATITVVAIDGFPEITPGKNIGELLCELVEFDPGDVVVVTQKIVSKSEGRLVAIDPTDHDAKRRLAESEAVRVLRRRGELVITETRHGFICANSGVDFSNIESGYAALLPIDPDRSARGIRDALRAIKSIDVGVVISDTFGRPWRRGLIDIAVGCAGIAAVVDLRGELDGSGRELVVTEMCIADEIAAAAELVMGKSSRIPAAIVRGVDRSWFRESSVSAEIVRAHAEDLFR